MQLHANRRQQDPEGHVSVRVDHNFNSNNRVFVRYSYDDTPFNRAPVYGQELSRIAPTAGPQIFTRWNTVLEDTHTFTPTTLMQFRYLGISAGRTSAARIRIIST